jgi:hypothetical protein
MPFALVIPSCRRGTSFSGQRASIARSQAGFFAPSPRSRRRHALRFRQCPESFSRWRATYFLCRKESRQRKLSKSNSNLPTSLFSGFFDKTSMSCRKTADILSAALRVSKRRFDPVLVGTFACALDRGYEEFKMDDPSPARRKKGGMMPICKMCGEEREKLIRCHIYPVSMSKEISGNPHCLVAMKSIGDKLISNYAHGGIYDDNIICASCENKFKSADDYAIAFRRRVLRLEGEFQLPLETAKFPSYGCNPEKLHTFAMQTWLRSHYSQRHESLGIENNSMAAKIASKLLCGQETIELDIDVSYLFFTCELAQVMIGPAYFPAPDYPLYSLWMPNMHVVIAASERGLPPGFSDIRIEKNKRVMVLRSKRILEPMHDTIIEGVLPHREKLEILFSTYERKG